jgi:hypothetical protein
MTPVAARSKVWVCGCSLAGIASSDLIGGMDVLFHESVVCCQVEVLATDRSLVQRSPTDCSVSECDREPYGEGLGPRGLLNHEKKGKKSLFSGT